MQNNDYLLSEGRLSDFKKIYADKLSPKTLEYVISNDPSGNQKYLMWVGKILTASDDEESEYVDPTEVMKDVALFHKTNKGIDLYSLKTFSELHDLVHKKETPSNRQKILDNTEIIINDKRWLVVAPKSHESSMFFGGGTKWCISTSSEAHWKSYYMEGGHNIIMIKDRSKKKGDSKWKTCLTIPPGDDDIDNAYIYDADDNGFSIRSSSFYTNIPSYVIEKINDYLSMADDGEERKNDYIMEKETEEINEYMKSEAINDVFKTYIDLMKRKYRQFPDIVIEFDNDDLKDFVFDFVGEADAEETCRHIMSNAISHHGWGDMYIRSEKEFENFLFEENTENAPVFNYALQSYVNEIIGVEKLLNIVENAIGKAKFDLIDSQYNLTDALRDCTDRYSRTVNQSAQLTLPNFPYHTLEKFKANNVNDIINLLYKYEYYNLSNLIKAYSTTVIKETRYKQFVAFLL